MVRPLAFFGGFNLLIKYSSIAGASKARSTGIGIKTNDLTFALDSYLGIPCLSKKNVTIPFKPGLRFSLTETKIPGTADVKVSQSSLNPVSDFHLNRESTIEEAQEVSQSRLNPVSDFHSFAEKIWSALL